MPKFPANVQDWTDTYHQVREEESGHVPIPIEEDSPASNESHNDTPSEGIVATEWLQPAFVGEGVAVDALRFHGLRNNRSLRENRTGNGGTHVIESEIRERDERKVQKL